MAVENRRVVLVRLPVPVMEALVRGDLATASELAGAPLTPYLVEEGWLWRIRLGQVADTSVGLEWIARAALDEATGEVVGHVGFHGPPDVDGMVEVAYSVDPAFRRRGYATAMLRAALEWAASEPAVRTVRASISPDNEASLATLRPFGFTHVGEQWDEEDGRELLFERTLGSSNRGVAVVTGAASGIGRALATQLSDEGHRVYLADLSPTQALAAELGGVPVPTDVADAEDMARLADLASAARTICLNAGMVGPTTGAPWEARPEEWQRVLAVNLGGVVNGLRAFVPPLLATGEPAQLLITASLAGLLTFPGGGAYAASKHAVLAVAEQAALALADTAVTVTVTCPALVRSAMSDSGAEPAVVAAEALAAARAGQFLVAPGEWSDAVRRRSEVLLSGAAPRLPTPAPGRP